LDSPTVLPEDKPKIRELLKKPWNPYIQRHSSLTDKSKILKEHVLRQHAGWSIGSDMPQKYLHYFGNESSESLLEAYGIVTSGQQIDHLKPKQCPNCSEPNKPDTKFCAKCRKHSSTKIVQELYTHPTLEESKREKRPGRDSSHLVNLVTLPFPKERATKGKSLGKMLRDIFCQD
jgi:hypothetical protein